VLSNLSIGGLSLESTNNVKFQYSKNTEIFLGFYISFGFFLVIVASVIKANPDINFLDIVKNNQYEIIKYIVYSISAGLITYIFRKKIFELKRPLEKDSNIVSKVDLLNFIYTSLMVLIGFGIFFSFTYADITYILMFLIMVVVITLNIYFGSFWRLTLIDINRSSLVSLKLEHGEWTSIYNSVLIGVIVFAGGIFFTNYNSNSSIIFIDGLLIIYVVLGAPILWLLRPIHTTMVRIRKEILELECNVQDKLSI